MWITTWGQGVTVLLVLPRCSAVVINGWRWGAILPGWANIGGYFWKNSCILFRFQECGHSILMKTWNCVFWLSSFFTARFHVRVLGAKSCWFTYPICILWSETRLPLPFATLWDGLTPCSWRSHPVPVTGVENLDIPPALVLLYIILDLVHELYLVAVGLAIAERWAT